MKASFLLLAAGFGLVTASFSTSTSAQDKENALIAASFHSRVADTPAKVASMNAMPPHSFVRRTQKKQTFYLYADPTGCHCLCYGTEENYGLYQQTRYQQRMSDMAAWAPIVDDPILLNYGFRFSAPGAGHSSCIEAPYSAASTVAAAALVAVPKRFST